MLVLERFQKALQHRNRVLPLPTRRQDRRTRESLAPTSEIEAEEAEVDDFILMEDEQYLAPRYHTCNVYPPPPLLALRYGVLQRRRYVNIAFYFHRSSLLYYPMAVTSPRQESGDRFYSNVGRIRRIC